MALNKAVFKTRAITAVLFAVIMLAGVLWNLESFLLLFTIVHFGCWWEYTKLLEKIHHEPIHLHQKIGWSVFGFGLMLLFAPMPYELMGYNFKNNFSLPLSLAGFAFIIAGIFQQKKITLKTFGATALGWVYISLAWGLLLDLRIYFIEEGHSIASGFALPLFIIISIWINDTMAYIVGSFIGKTPLSSISPKKTWEGTIGGILIASVVTGLLFSYLSKDGQVNIPIPTYLFYVLAALIAIAGTLGDLLESKLKRMADVKDSGNFMPGHGGFLDRFDSLLVAVPFVWVLLKLAL